MITVRDMREGDTQTMMRLHALQGLAYELPGADGGLWVTRKVAEEQGTPRAALLLRLTCEGFFLCEPATPRATARRFLRLFEESRRGAAEAGLDSAHAWLPPEMHHSFGAILLGRGWQENLWPSYSLRLG